MKKWVIIGLVTFLLFITGLFVYFINEAIQAGSNVDENYINVAIKQTPLVEINKAEHYYGTEHLIILFGKDEAEEEMVVWINEDLSMLRHAWLKESVGKEKIAQLVLANYDVEKEIHIIPGIENDFFVWEALYRTKQGEYLYTYFDFFTGELLRSIKLKSH